MLHNVADLMIGEVMLEVSLAIAHLDSATINIVHADEKAYVWLKFEPCFATNRPISLTNTSLLPKKLCVIEYE